MSANDRDLDRVDVALTDFTTVFHYPDYEMRYARTRVELIKRVGDIQKSLTLIRNQIAALRDGSALTNDQGAQAQLRSVASDLQRAYDKQYQLTTDLTGVIQAMMDYRPPEDLNIAQAELQEQRMPPEMRSVKSYLRFDQQRAALASAESAAADTAITLAETRCLK